MSVIARQDIVPGKTLLFLDEIQQCPRAIMALRYFHEKLPELHVIAAGSLIAAAVPLMVFLIFQRYFIEGLTVGAVKG